MLGKRKKSHSKEVLTIFIVAILCLNIVGISYAKFNSDLELSATLRTGSMEPEFGENFKFHDELGSGHLKAKLDKEGAIFIKGMVETGYKADLEYSIINNGSIPFEYIEDSLDSQDGLNLKLKQDNTFFAPNRSYSDRKENSKLKIKTEDSGEYDFEIELLFRQEND